jgi:hypothetical protein
MTMIADRVLGAVDGRERERFLKHALRFVTKDRDEAERVVAALCRQFPGVKTLIVDATCVAFQYVEGERAVTVFFLIGWFAAQDRTFICE